MPVVVRPARAGDGDARARLWRDAGRYFVELSPDTGQEPDPRGLAEWMEELYGRFADDPARLMLIAEVDGEVVGLVAARLCEPEPSARWQVQSDLGRRRVHVDALAVAQSYRRFGAGTALMTAVERWALERGAEVITLETDLGNPTAVPFYGSRMGYTQREVQFRKVLDRPASGGGDGDRRLEAGRSGDLSA